ncbi:MAG: reverse transcriptase family protein [Planctomycetota bacterium]|nr:reverse transcriptase family protein [Planctomycetota bacterium]
MGTGLPIALAPVLWVVLVFTFLIAALILGSIWSAKRLRWIWLTNRRPKEYKRALRGEGLGVDALAERLDVTVHRLEVGTPVYERREIPKRRGGKRVLHVPDERTKGIQRAILRRLLARLKAHPAAMAFEKGRSIVHNALPHVGRPVIARLDLVEFFPNTSAERIDAYFRRIGWDADAAALLVKWTTHKGGLPQGAPTSPRLSNLVNYYLDVQIARHMEARGGTYTRYADDITLGFPTWHPRFGRGRIQWVRRLVKVHGYRLHGRPKLRVMSRHKRQLVTGLVVNERVQLPRETRRWLRAVRHRLATGREATLTEAQLAGWDALEGMIRRQVRQARKQA